MQGISIGVVNRSERGWTAWLAGETEIDRDRLERRHLPTDMIFALRRP
jgi:hypothetical protein